MAFTFFTLGGKQLWEDLFFYQGWRIQRNCLTKRYRLLDSWDIRRESGTLLHCQNAFIHYIEVYQLLRPKQKAVVMLHGLSQTKDIFESMSTAFEKESFTSIAINYPSLRKNFDNFTEQLNFLLKNLKDIQEVNFIVYGLGGLILRKLLSKYSSWQSRIRIGRAVMINVPNQGWTGGERLGKIALFAKFIPALKIYESENIKRLPNIPQKLDTGILTTWNPITSVFIKILPEKLRRLLPAAKDSHIDSAKEILSAKTFNIFPTKNKSVIMYCINFIKTGKFNSSQKIKKL